VDHNSSMTLEYAREMAQALAKLLAPACEKIMVAGSIRRQKARPNDIELVAVPRWDCIPHPVRLWDNVPTTDKMRTNLLETGSWSRASASVEPAQKIVRWPVAASGR